MSACPSLVDGREAPTLRLVSLRGRTDGPELVGRARVLVDEFVRRARGVQAVVMTCRPSRAPYLLRHTAYESAGGVQGPYTLHRAWFARFLRGVSADGIRLGPELLARVDREALAALCVVEPVGETVRIVLREDASLDALERALAQVLPSREDGIAATRAR